MLHAATSILLQNHCLEPVTFNLKFFIICYLFCCLAQKLRLGWDAIGNFTHQPHVLANVNKTILENGRPTIFDTCRGCETCQK